MEDWIEALQAAPERLPEDTAKLAPLDFGKTPEEWQERRQKIEQRWLDFMGGLPDKRCDLNLQVLESEDLGDITRQLVTYNTEANSPVHAYLLQPKDAGPHPGMVVFHPTDPKTIQCSAGLGGKEDRQLGPRLARAGYVVLVPRNMIWEAYGISVEIPHPKAWEQIGPRLRDAHPGMTAMAKMVWDGMRAADVLQSLEEVDSERLGCIGHSLGGKEALYIPAFDQRFRAAVSSEGGTGLAYCNWDSEWYLGPRIREPGFAMDNHEIIALIAPRALLITGSDTGADGKRSWPFITSVLPLYRMLGAPDALGMLDHKFGHNIPPVAWETALRWFKKFLG